MDDHRVVNICMEEIKRCQETSLGIAFIAILGDKYGWRPLPPSVNADEFESLLQLIDQSDRELVTTWYLRDDNSIPPCYLLQPISSQFPGIKSADKDEISKAWEGWGKVEKSIWTQLRSAADKADLEENEKQKYTVSVTQSEVESAVVLDPEGSERSIIIDRRFDHINGKDKAARNFVNLKVNTFFGRKKYIRQVFFLEISLNKQMILKGKLTTVVETTYRITRMEVDGSSSISISR